MPTGCCARAQPGYQLTWMDAKVGDWVVTPRRGKAVEINALWYNALRLLEQWLRDEVDEAAARPIQEAAARARESFNRRFWYAEGGYLYDVVDGESGDDTACRPNQVMAISLEHPVLEQPRWQPVMDVVTDRLLTPMGLRSLAPGHPDYKSEIRWRSALARCRLSSGHRLGLADRPIHRCVAESESWRSHARPPVPGRFHSASERGLHRLDQRNLRCRGALHAARLHRPGVERGGGAAMLGEDGRHGYN